MTLIVSTSDLATVYAAGFRSTGVKGGEIAVEGFLTKLGQLDRDVHIGDAFSAWEIPGNPAPFMRPGTEHLVDPVRELTEHFGPAPERG